MLPIQLAGLALAGRTLVIKYSGAPDNDTQSNKTTIRPKQRTPKPKGSYMPVQNPVNTLVKGLTTTVSQITKGLAGEDYYAVVKGFVPSGTELIAPENSIKPRDIQFSDLDGDSRDELVASYRHNDGIRTIVLKKNGEKWDKSAEIDNSGFEGIKHRGFAGITGEGKKQLLIGFSQKNKDQLLKVYSMEDGRLDEIFDHSYSRFEVLNHPVKGKTSPEVHLAIWNRTGSGTYDIEVYRWAGTELEKLKDTKHYYLENVVPHYAHRVKQARYSPSNWYGLADALLKAGVHEDARIAAEVGMSLDTGSALKESFAELKNRIGN
jgi:hypothetical protein